VTAPAPPRRIRGASALSAIEATKAEYAEGAAERKRALLDALADARLSSAREVFRFHEVLCFLRAYPDDPGVLARVEDLVRGFERRPDLRRWRRALADTGIAGTPIRYRFFQPTASWLARRWPDRLTIDWRTFEGKARLEPLLSLLALPAEAPGLDEIAFSVREWVARLKGPAETDAAFLVRRFDALAVHPFVREKIYDALDPPLRLHPGPDTPARGREKHHGSPVVFQTRPLSRSRPSLRLEARRPPLAMRAVGPREGSRLVDLARGAMVTRSRDLDVFCHADPRAVRLVECGGGLQFACFGAVPERRLLLEAVYGFLTLKNGVPIGYVLASALFRSAEIAYNVFETWRGAEAAAVYGRVLGTVRALFGVDSFTIVPYQLGHDNDEALGSGAWWFYQKLGFRPKDRAVIRLMREELAAMARDPAHRSGIPTLRRLAVANVFLHLAKPRPDVLGVLPLANVGLRVTQFLAERVGSRREQAQRECAREAARRLGVRGLGRWSRGERLAWRQWGPLVTVLPGLDRWTAEERRGLVEVIRAKGGPRETDFVVRFDRHRRLRDAVRRLAESLPP
jgi:hypothetical protein